MKPNQFTKQHTHGQIHTDNIDGASVPPHGQFINHMTGEPKTYLDPSMPALHTSPANNREIRNTFSMGEQKETTRWKDHESQVC